jgi:hypothetical protein
MHPRQVLTTFVSVFSLCILINLADRLVGSWSSEPIKTEWGIATFELNFQNDGHLRFIMMSEGGGSNFTREGAYKVKNGQFVSEVFDEGQPAAISFRGEDLLVDTASQPPRRFKRK